MKKHMFALIVCSLALSRSLVAADKPAAVPLKLAADHLPRGPQVQLRTRQPDDRRDGMVYLSLGRAGQRLHPPRQPRRPGQAGRGLGARHPQRHGRRRRPDRRRPTAISPTRWRSTTRSSKRRQAVTDFLVSDQVGWDAPGSVEAGASGDFYGLDQHRDRIVQLNADGKIVRAYALPHIDKCSATGLPRVRKGAGLLHRPLGQAGGAVPSASTAK